jgi:ATP-dependent Clp protease ATP-binding subunit ClpA
MMSVIWLELIMSELGRTFRPEFLNRIDEIIIFEALEKDVVRQIIDKLINDLELELKDKNLKIELTNKAKKLILA